MFPVRLSSSGGGGGHDDSPVGEIRGSGAGAGPEVDTDGVCLTEGRGEWCAGGGEGDGEMRAVELAPTHNVSILGDEPVFKALSWL